MLKDITIGQYIPGNTIIHKLDPRIKILSVIFFITALFSIESFYPYVFVIAFILLVIRLSKVPLKVVIKSLKPIWFIAALTLFINIFFTEGSLLFKIGPLIATKEGVRQGLFMVIRLALLILGTTLLTLTTSPMAFTDGLEKLLSPFSKIGLPSHELAMMMTIALRFIPTLMEETDKIMKAQMARGADFESGNLINRAKNMVPLLVPLFINSFRRAEELADAMEARCYRGGEGRTRLKELKLENIDFYASVFSIIYFSFIISTRYISYFK